MMIAEFAWFALLLAGILAGLLACLPWYGCLRGKEAWLLIARPLAYGQMLFLGLAFFGLAYLLLVCDFSVAYVAHHANTALPAIYRFCAVWGAHEGSMLLWVFSLSLWTGLVARLSHHLPLATVARVLAVLGMISVSFIVFILSSSNPFTRLLPTPPSNGLDLNPLLQDPGLVSHPPMLYMGYVGFSVAFAFAITALIEKRFDKTWVLWVRPWTLAAWCFLTLGITMGSWWSYHQLGWGGWWFWDPVENASFLPWLAGTALLHSLVVASKRDGFKGWILLLAMMAFSLSLLGTFLVRSGILVSVHAFAVDPQRGLIMLAMLMTVLVLSLGLYCLRANHVRQAIPFHHFSREAAILANNVVLMVMLATILLGTLYPLVLQVLSIAKISVGMPYFNTVFTPLMLAMMLLMAFAPYTVWQRDSRARFRPLLICVIVSVIIGFSVPWLLVGKIVWASSLALSLTVLLMVASLWQPGSMRGRLGLWGMRLAHSGVAVCAIGIILSQGLSQQRDVLMEVGDDFSLGPFSIHFQGIDPLKGPNYSGLVGQFEVKREEHVVTLLHAEKRIYEQAGNIAKTQAAIYPAMIHEVYLVLGQQATEGWHVRAYYKPLVRWIWLGGFVMMLGGVLAMLDRRLRREHA